MRINNSNTPAEQMENQSVGLNRRRHKVKKHHRRSHEKCLTRWYLRPLAKKCSQSQGPLDNINIARNGVLTLALDFVTEIPTITPSLLGLANH